jgi:ubiquinone/menaquinone biosynthesis C-methylase UbiE
MELDLKESWNRWAEKHPDPYLSVQRSSNRGELKIIVQDVGKKLSLKKGERLLDAGCGSGVLLSKLVNEFNIIGAGIDFSEKEIGIAKSQFPNIPFEVGSVESIPFPDHSFDKVLCYGVLLYVKEWKLALQELLRVCKEGGMILLGDLPSISHRSKLYWEYLKKVPRGILHWDHLKNIFQYRGTAHWYWLDLESIVQYLKSLGWEGEILSQPKGHKQYGGITGNYRFDILVQKGATHQ